MEPDPVQQAKHHAAIAEWGKKYGLPFQNGVCTGKDGARQVIIDLTATHSDFWAQTVLLQAFECGFSCGEKNKAANIRAALGIQNTVEE